jgi:hypothetical protein
MATYSSKVSKAVALGKKNSSCLKTNLITVNGLLRLVRCYTTFTETVTSAWAIEFNFDNSDGNTIEVELEVNGSPVVYSGTGTSAEVAQYFYQYFYQGATLGETWYSEIEGNTVYLWTYDTGTDYTAILNLSSDYGTITSLENNLDTILDLWNCVPYEDACSAYELCNTIMNETNCNCL